MRNLCFSISSIFLLSLFCASCSIPIKGKNESVHHLIIGIGIVTTAKEDKNIGVLAVKTQTIGLQLSDQPGLKFALGYSDSSVVSVPETTENIVVEVNQPVLGPLTVEVNPKPKGGKEGYEQNKND